MRISLTQERSIRSDLPRLEWCRADNRRRKLEVMRLRESSTNVPTGARQIIHHSFNIDSGSLIRHPEHDLARAVAFPGKQCERGATSGAELRQRGMDSVRIHLRVECWEGEILAHLASRIAVCTASLKASTRLGDLNGVRILASV